MKFCNCSGFENKTGPPDNSPPPIRKNCAYISQKGSLLLPSSPLFFACNFQSCTYKKFSLPSFHSSPNTSASIPCHLYSYLRSRERQQNIQNLRCRSPFHCCIFSLCMWQIVALVEEVWCIQGHCHIPLFPWRVGFLCWVRRQYSIPLHPRTNFGTARKVSCIDSLLYNFLPSTRSLPSDSA